MPASAVISVLARSLLAGDADVAAVHARAVKTLGRDWPWLLRMSQRFVDQFRGRTRPRHRDVIRFLLEDPDFLRGRARLSIAEWLPEPPRMQPVAAASRWNLPVIETVGDLADWLSLYPAELEWFADIKRLSDKVRNPKLRHYHYRILVKRSGGLRLIESPKSDLKAVQRRLLSGVLDRIPIHHAAHGFVKRRSIVTFAAPHVASNALLRLDLENFFPASPAARIQALFRTLGYPEQVAVRMAGLCANIVPHEVWTAAPSGLPTSTLRDARLLYARYHLPQGAPTSPALANLMAYRLDCRLSGLARTAGAVYTRYADDLAFSGGPDFARIVERFSTHAAAVALEEGFGVNHHKTRIMPPGVRQHLAGIIVNRKLSIRRTDLERLEAILTNCVRSGPQSQNRGALPDFRSHLQGRIAFVTMVDPVKGHRLQAVYDSIQW